ncbi:MAG: DNA polymerase III subunit beta [Pseudomonadota bacterium]|nr:DNA polymerase III subunit beta [Pseudomonadota bacterium]
MQITLRREDLLKPLGFVAAVAERRQTLPILSNVLLRYRQGRLTLTGTDLEVEIQVVVPADGREDSECTLPAKKLLDICRALPAEATLEIKLEKGKALIKSGRSRFSLLTLQASEFPSIETSEWEWGLTIPQDKLSRLLQKTQFCMAQQDVRYYLNGLLLEVTAGKLDAVATDGHRMALGEIALDHGVEGDRQGIVPRKGVLELTRFLKEDSAEEVELKGSANHFRVVAKDLIFTTKLIDGRFPDYHKVIPAGQQIAVRVARTLFRESLARVAILSNEKYRGVRLVLSDGLLRLNAHNPEQEEAHEELRVEYHGEEFEIGFNVTYLMEAAGALDSEEVELGLTDSNSSCLLRAPGDSWIQYVVMPMRL